MDEVFQMLIVFGAIVLSIKYIIEYALRKRLIDKGLVDEKVKYLFADSGVTQLLSNIKWGFLLVAIGIALLWREFADFDVEDSTVFGVMFLLMGIGFLVYYFIAKSYVEKRKRESGQ
jgi:hypothetical protein